MYPRIPWELVIDLLRSPDHTFGTTELDELAHSYTHHEAADFFNPLEIDFHLNCLCISTNVPAQITCCVFITKCKWLIEDSEIFDMCCEHCLNHINVMCAKIQKF